MSNARREKPGYLIARDSLLIAAVKAVYFLWHFPAGRQKSGDRSMLSHGAFPMEFGLSYRQYFWRSALQTRLSKNNTSNIKSKVKS